MGAEILTKEKYREMYNLAQKRCDGLRAMAEKLITADKKIVIDIAATGNNTKEDEVYKLSVVDINGYVIFDSFFAPENGRNKFRIKMLSIEENAPSLSDQLLKIDEILLSANTIAPPIKPCRN